MLLQNKIVIVSGIGPGLGTHLATLAAQNGASLVAVARTPSKLDAVAAEVERLSPGTEVVKVAADISRREDCRRVVATAIDRFGRVDVLINSAFIAGALVPFENADLDDWRTTFEVNLFGSLNMCQEVIPHMKRERSGSIVNVNSQVVHKPLACNGGYAASKAALACATSYIALECGTYGIRANSVFLGWMWGPSVAGYFEGVAKETGATVEALRAGVAQNIALRRVPEDRDCAKSIIYLASDLACVVTGASLDVNGGEYFPS